MITDTFDPHSPAIINPPALPENAPQVDACIITFSWQIEKAVAESYASGGNRIPLVRLGPDPGLPDRAGRETVRLLPDLRRRADHRRADRGHAGGVPVR